MAKAWQLPTMETHGRVATEHEEQCDFVRWARQNYPEHRVFAVPNGGKRSPSEAMRLQAEGVTAGVPDLFFPSLLLWIEMKRPPKGKRGGGRGRVSADQGDWHSYLRDIGHRVVVCYTSLEAQCELSAM